MAKKNIYEISGERKRRPGRSTNYRTATKESIDKLNKSSQTLGNDVKYSAVETAFISTSGFGVEAPWKEKTNFKFTSDVVSEYEQDERVGPRKRGEASTPFSKEEMDSFIEETARALQEELGLENVDIRTVYGNYDIDHKNARVGGIKFGSDNHIEIYPDTIWRNLENGYYPEIRTNAKNFYNNLRETIAHEMRHAWQYTTEGGKPILEAQKKYKAGEKVKKYKARVNKKWNDDFKKYWQEPIEVDARRTAKKYKSDRKGKKIINKYRKKLEQEKINEQKFREKLEEIQTRPKNRIIGHEEDGPYSTGSSTQSNETIETTSGPETTPQSETAPEVNPEPETQVETRPEVNTPDPDPEPEPDTTVVNQPEPEPAGPKQGDAFWDKKNKRQLIYDGPDNVHGNHNFYTREGTVVNSSIDDLSPYKGKARLDYDMLKNYNTELNRFEQLTSPYFNLKYNDPETFYTDLTKNINKIDEYEKAIGSKYKSFKGNKSYHKTRSYMSDEINKYFGSEIIGKDPFNKKKNNTSTGPDTTVVNQPEPEPDTTVVNQPEPEPDTTVVNPQPNFDPEDPSTWTDDYIESIRQVDPDYANELEELRKNNTVNTEGEYSPKGFNIEDPTTWTDENLEGIKESDPEYYEELIKMRKEAEAAKYYDSTQTPIEHNHVPEQDFSNATPEQKPIIKKPLEPKSARKPGPWINAPEVESVVKLKPEVPDVNKMPLVNKVHTGASASPMIKNITPDVRFDLDTPSRFGKLGKLDILMTGVNLLGAVGDYKAERRKGKGVVSSAARSAANFAIGEALGFWGTIGVGLVKTVPGAVIKGADILYKENRRMNSAANQQLFGDAQFMDTQQLATMRQSGMEMAKMAQYNLQQTLMGNEATYLHR